MGMGSRRRVVRLRREGEMVDGGCTADVSVGDQPKLAERRQSAIDGRPVNTRSQCLGPRDDLIGRQVIISAVENLDDCLASSGHALMLGAKQAQRSLDSRLEWHANESIATLSHLAADAIPSHLGCPAEM